jgi:organic radical activating enzyme
MSRSESDKSLIKQKVAASDTFCTMPWIHLHTTPEGVAAPCCIAESCSNHVGMGNAKTQRLMDLVNSPKMRQLRLDMLDGKKNTECQKCYQHEDAGIESYRQSVNTVYPNSYDDVYENTNLEDGSLDKFNMRYYDIRFSNICNFKCRTCGQEYSSQWEQENLRNNVSYALEFPKNSNKEFLQDVLDQIPNMEVAYFAGGEPLITEEHYILIEDMIRQNRTDIVLRYNTNLSNLKFKNKDLIGLWKHFTKPVEVYASVDHVKERAEYIRHGTDWGVVENNCWAIRKEPNVRLQFNTVLSAFNYLTIDKFYGYLIDIGLYSNRDGLYTLYNMSHPEFLSVHVLPEEYKQLGKESVDRAISQMESLNFNHSKIDQLRNTHVWSTSENYWEEKKELFKNEITRIDLIRGEDFRKTFPELAPLMDL